MNTVLFWTSITVLGIVLAYLIYARIRGPLQMPTHDQIMRCIQNEWKTLEDLRSELKSQGFDIEKPELEDELNEMQRRGYINQYTPEDGSEPTQYQAIIKNRF